MSMRVLIVISLLVAQAIPAGAQNFDLFGNADSANYVAFHIKQPHLKRGLETWDYWTGLSVKVGGMTAGFSTGSFTDPSGDDFLGPRNGWMVNLGAQYPFWKPSGKGRLSLGSMRVEPYFAFGFALTRIGVDGEDVKALGYGLQAYPGLLLRVSSLYIDLRPESYLLINNPFLMPKDSRNGASGFVFMPSLALGFDGMFDIFSPVFNSQTIHSKVYKSRQIGSVTTGYTVVYDPSLGTWVHTRYTDNIYEVWEEDKYTTYNNYLSGPFLFLGPRAKLMQVRPDVGRTLMYGANLGARFGAFGIDAYYQEGEYGLHGGISRQEIQDLYPGDPELSFRSVIPAREMGASFHINPWGKAYKNNRNPFLRDVPFFRLSGKLNISYLEFTGDPVYASPAYEQILGQYFDDYPLVERSSSNDASRLPATALGLGWGIGVEFGAASLSYDVIRYKDAPIARQQTFSIGLNIPWGKIAKKLSDRRMYKRMLMGEGQGDD